MINRKFNRKRKKISLKIIFCVIFKLLTLSIVSSHLAGTLVKCQYLIFLKSKKCLIFFLRKNSLPTLRLSRLHTIVARDQLVSELFDSYPADVLCRRLNGLTPPSHFIANFHSKINASFGVICNNIKMKKNPFKTWQRISIQGIQSLLGTGI